MPRQRSLTDDQVREIRAWIPRICGHCGSVLESENRMAKRYRQKPGTVRAVINGTTYKDVK